MVTESLVMIVSLLEYWDNYPIIVSVVTMNVVIATVRLVTVSMVITTQ